MDEQEEVSQKEVTTPHGQLDDFDDVFAHWLGPGTRPEVPSVPIASPPCPICLVVLVLTTERDSYENLENSALHCNDRDEAENGM